MASSSGSGTARQRSAWACFGCCSDQFDIPGKATPFEQLERWRKGSLVLNASRRFRYTLDMKKEEQKEEVRRKIRAQAHVIRAAFRFKEASIIETAVPLADVAFGFQIRKDHLTTLTKNHYYSALQSYEGISGVARKLKTDTEKGISGDDLDLRRNAFGSNIYPRKKGRSFLAFVWDACKNLTLIILMVAAVVSLALGLTTEGIKEGWYEGASIAISVLLIVFVTATSDYKQSLQFHDLNEEKQNIHLEVVRDGKREIVSIYDLVVGDVVPLKTGDQIPADGILISGHSLSIDESSITGESKEVYKDQKSPFLMSGCKVLNGYGTMLVTVVGINTEWGLLMASTSEDSCEETPLQVRLNGVATFVGMVGISIALTVLIALLTRYFTGHTYNPNGSVQYVKGKMGVGQMIHVVVRIITVAVTIVVVAVPEGLPLAVTLTLAFSMRKMMMDKALVRRLSACEMMGSATTICSDKTGTLTSNRMAVVEAYFGGEKMNSPDNPRMVGMIKILVINGIAHNTSGTIFEPEDGQELQVTGSATEKAIQSWGLKLGMQFSEIGSKHSILHVVPFNSDKKRSGVAIALDGSDVQIHWKGAAEIILDSCSCWLDTCSLEHSMTTEKVAEFKKFIEDMATASLRCVAFAYRAYKMSDVPNDNQRDDWKLPEDNLTMLGIVGIKDPCRPGVRDSVRLCMAAGIKVRMVTGDNLRTARAVALECGILSDPNASEPIIIEGKTFRALSDKDREEAAQNISVMGSSSPYDKLLLVKALKKRGHVVAVTGDGANDAPALREADIGLSMGIRGTEVAKESSDIIILDDNFESVVMVVKWGRSVRANIQKFIQFHLTVNIAALIINVVAAISSGNMPLDAVQLLWVNLIMDTLGALAMATESPMDHLMQKQPVGRREPLVTNIMWKNLIIMVLFQVSVLLTLNFRGTSLLQLKNDYPAHADKVKNTFVFNTFVLCQVFNEFNSRRPDRLNMFKGISGDHLFIVIVAVTIILQAIIVEYLGKFTSTVRLNLRLWLVSIGLAFLSLPLAFMGKLIPFPDHLFEDFFAYCCLGRIQASGDNEDTAERNV